MRARPAAHPPHPSPKPAPSSERTAKRAGSAPPPHPGLDEDLGGQGLRRAPEQEVGGAGRVADAELDPRVAVEPTPEEVGSRVLAFVALQPHRVVQGERGIVRAGKRTTLACRPAL